MKFNPQCELQNVNSAAGRLWPRHIIIRTRPARPPNADKSMQLGVVPALPVTATSRAGDWDAPPWLAGDGGDRAVAPASGALRRSLCAAELEIEAGLGLGRIVALHDRSKVKTSRAVLIHFRPDSLTARCLSL